MCVIGSAMFLLGVGSEREVRAGERITELRERQPSGVPVILARDDHDRAARTAL
jgi:hypothetical protein